MIWAGNPPASLREAILVTLLYFDHFSYPLNKKEIWFWLPIRASSQEIDWQLASLVKGKAIGYQEPFYFLSAPKNIKKRCQKEADSLSKLVLAQKMAAKMATLPQVGLVALTGNLAMKSANQNDDIDFLLIACSGCLYQMRLTTVLATSLWGWRRRPKDTQVANKACLNIFWEANNLALPIDHQDFYTAHESLQLQVLAGDFGYYRQFLENNPWLDNYLPGAYQQRLIDFAHFPLPVANFKTKSPPETLAKLAQLAYMRLTNPRSSWPISRQLFFHPQDVRQGKLADFEANWRQQLIKK